VDLAGKAAIVTGGSNGRALGLAVDVSSADDVSVMTSTAVEEFGGVDLCYNNAAIQINGSVTDLEEADWDRVFAVNVNGIYLCSRACNPHMRSKGGAIVNAASIQGMASQKGVAAYAPSKGAVIELTRRMAHDYAGDRIRVNCICPGSVDTPMLRRNASAGGDAGAYRIA
jgi:NAD(P)-dependent dehydrogenase (short-subunit alcohol dehydrogenase family)